MTTKRLCVLLSLFAMLAFALSSAQPSAAQPDQPPVTPPLERQPPAPPGLPDTQPDGRVQTSDGLWIRSAENQEPGQPDAHAPASTGGPDDFGYTWNNLIAFNWIDANGGTDTGVSATVDHAGPFAIGFPFKHYENTYTELYVSRFGFLAFDEDSIENHQSRIPSTERPNNVVAPQWVPVDRVDGYVRYLRGGVAPNRWFVVEWNRLVSECCNDPAEVYTFQAILHENGDVLFQYGKMTTSGAGWCTASGIEDSTGVDGLATQSFCFPAPGNSAVRITRPAPAARVRVMPLFQGRFTRPGGTAAFRVAVIRAGQRDQQHKLGHKR